MEILFKQLKEANELKNIKELNLIDKYNIILKKEVDKLKYEYNQQEKTIKLLHKSLYLKSKIFIKKSNEESMNKLKILKSKIEKSKNQYNQAKKQQSNLLKIIEICNINNDINKKWVRKINILINNMNQMIISENKRMKELVEEIDEIKKIYNETNLIYTSKHDNQNEFCNDFINSIKNNKNDDVNKFYENILINHKPKVSSAFNTINEKNFKRFKTIKKKNTSFIEKDYNEINKIYKEICEFLNVEDIDLSDLKKHPKIMNLSLNIEKNDDLRIKYIKTKIKKEDFEKKLKDLKKIMKINYDLDEKYNYDNELSESEKLDIELKELDEKIKIEQTNKIKLLDEFNNNYGFLENDNLFKKNKNKYEINYDILENVSQKINFLKNNLDFEEFNKIINWNYNNL